ncbi:hypothetical protein QYE76_014279 [Lolium multiflorum]|uniref:Uncharacterized protein n=1 Tax=Lolium multiflorum TaxID=4521 RepID=A0AAD8U2Q2_LOLMU|nr:hypothetical protein QYE76_014279 [Lolium multiflorum]
MKEFDSAWYDATNNVVVKHADARKQLFEELLWEHRDLAEAHSHCQVVPEASLEALKAQVTKLQGEKEQLLKEHNEALEAQKTALGELKEQAIQAALRHEQALRTPGAEARRRAFPGISGLCREEGVWPEEELPENITLTPTGSRMPGTGSREWQCSAARAGADTALRSACSWYPARIWMLSRRTRRCSYGHGSGAAAKRQDRAYRLAEYAEVRTFIPPPPGVKDYLSDEEEEDEGDEDEAAEDVPPEAPGRRCSPKMPRPVPLHPTPALMTFYQMFACDLSWPCLPQKQCLLNSAPVCRGL